MFLSCYFICLIQKINIRHVLMISTQVPLSKFVSPPQGEQQTLTLRFGRMIMINKQI